MRRSNLRFFRARRGFSAMLSMLFLSLFSTLAVGFYAATSTSVQVSANDQRAVLAQTAAESGMDLMRYQLAHVSVPPGTPSNMVMSTIFTQLSTNMNGTRNMGSNVVGFAGNVIYIPANTNNIIKLDSAGLSTFAITITAWGSDIVVKSTGNYGATSQVSRSITMDFTSKPIPTDSFNYAVISKGQVVVNKGTISGATGVNPAIACLMSDLSTAGSVSVSGGTVGGDLHIVSGATANITGGSVGGTSIPSQIRSQHVHVVGHPDFPTVDTSVYLPYATNTYVANASPQQNIIIPPGTNPKFNAGDTIQGIIFVKSPNTVTFRGTVRLQGFIVFENAGSSAVNVLDFKGNVSQTPLPAAHTFDALRSVSGVAMLAPTAAVSMSGSYDSNAKGSLILGSFSMGGAANLYIDNGTIMTLDAGPNSATFNGTKGVLFTATGEQNQPSAGMSYNSYFAPKPSTYQEIMP